MKHIFYSLATLSCLCFGACSTSETGAESDKTIAVVSAADSTKAASLSLDSLRNNLRTNLKSIKSYKGLTNTETVTVPGLQMQVALFAVYGDLIKQGLLSQDPQCKKLAAQLKKQVVTLQMREFPKLRKAYISFSRKALFRNNVAVSNGNEAGYREIILTGGIFANNANVEDMQTNLMEVLGQLRFKKAGYRWYEEQDGYPQYTMPTYADNRVSEKTAGR